MDGLLAAVSALGDCIVAYKARVAELEAIVANQQAQLAELKPTKEVS